MANTFFAFKQFVIHQAHSAMKVSTDACLFGAWVATRLPQQGGTVVDAGAGTGLLSLMLAQALHKAHFTAIEIDDNAAMDAAANFAQSPFASRIHLEKGNLFTLASPRVPYHLVVSNPPFYQGQLASSRADKNLAHHSTAFSLQAFCTWAFEHTTATGRLAWLLPAYREAEARVLLKTTGWHLQQLCYVHQTVHHSKPFRLMAISSKQPAQPFINTEQIYIKQGNDAYTEAFTNLLQPYYLYL